MLLLVEVNATNIERIWTFFLPGFYEIWLNLNFLCQGARKIGFNAALLSLLSLISASLVHVLIGRLNSPAVKTSFLIKICLEFCVLFPF